MSEIDLEALTSPPPPPRKSEAAALAKRSGTDIGVTFDEGRNEGSISFDATELIDPDGLDVWDWILRDYFGEFWERYEVIEGSVKVGMHEGFYVNHETAVPHRDADGKITSWEKNRTSGTAQMRRYSARIRRRAGVLPKMVREDLDAAIAAAKKVTRSKRKNHGADCAVICLADLQLGKTQRGLSTPDNLLNIYDRMNQSVEWLKELKPRRIVLVNPGDTVEACDGFYATQTYDVDLNNREQLRAGLQVLSDHLDAYSPLAPEIEMTTAPSNHGEFRVGNGKTNTDPARDNRDLVLSDMLAELAPHKWPHLVINVPHETDGDPYLASFLTSDGEWARRIGVIHGHQVRAAGGAPIVKLANWWANNFMSDTNRPRQAEGIWPEQCHMLIAGHFHHLNMYTGKSRMVITCPASDLGSEWYSTGSGFDNPAGLLCLVLNESHPHLVESTKIFAAGAA